MFLHSSLLFTSAGISESVNLRESLVLFCFSHEGLYLTCWKQLRTLGSMLLPPKAATSPSCRGIWIASWSSRPSCLWSHISVGPATSLKRSVTPKKDTILFCFHVHFLSFSNAAAQAFNFYIIVWLQMASVPFTRVYLHLILTCNHTNEKNKAKRNETIWLLMARGGQEGDLRQFSFTSKNSCLTNLMTSYGRVTTLVDRAWLQMSSLCTSVRILTQSSTTSLSLNWREKDSMGRL